MRRRGAKMIGRRLIAAAAILSSCVVSLPVSPGQLENDDVEVMKCIVEALADVVSRPQPQPSPITQECVLTLKSDDRLVRILRHHKFLKELQEMAVEGSQERALLQPDGAALRRATARPPAGQQAADRSMLEALGGPGERSILSQEKRNEDGEDDSRPPPDGEQRGEVEVEGGGRAAAKTGKPESPPHLGSRSAQEQHKRADLTSPEENTTTRNKGSAWDEKRESRSSKEKTEANEEEEAKAKRLSEEEEEEKEEEGMKSWTQRAKGRGRGKEARLQAASHHSREAKAPEEEEEEEEEEQEQEREGEGRSPEERELQMLAGREPQQRALLEEEGSAARRTEEPEIQSLAAIESELENVAQKLHDLRRG